MAAARLYSATVQAHWLDALDHVYFLEYLRAADKATDRFWIEMGGEPASASTALALVIVESHVHYLSELRLGDRVDVETHVVAYDSRRLHLYHQVLRAGEVTSVVQFLGFAFHAGARRASFWPQHMLEAFSWRDMAHVARLDRLMNWQLRAHGDR